MSKLSLCILDDKIPVEHLSGIEINNTSCIDANIIRHCLTLKKGNGTIDDWGDADLRSFIDAVKDDYIISGFKNHQFFFNYSEDILFSPDIVIFDWDMGDGGQDSSDNLLKLLSTTYCLVAIFTGEDTQGGVSQEIKKPKFEKYNHRCFLIKKYDSDSANALKTEIKKREKDFSFEFGNEFRKASLAALNNILVELGKVTSDELNQYFNIEDENDLRGFIAEKHSALFSLNETKLSFQRGKYKWADSLLHMVRKKFERVLTSLNIPCVDGGTQPQIKEDILERLWSYRLYHKYQDSDKKVRKGDIIHDADGNYYLIINSDCHLPRLWTKNLGFVNVIPLHRVDNSNENLKMILNLTKNGETRDYKQHSFSETMKSFSEGAFCMPFIQVKDNQYETFLFFAKTITSIQVATPPINNDENLKTKIFTYDLFGEYSRICTLSEPFLTPIISNILSTIAGHGCPDYSDATKNLLDKKIKQIFL